VDSIVPQDGEMEPTIIESCHSTWIFDIEGMRFRRILLDVESGGRRVATDWRPYYRLEVDPYSETFIVYLNIAGTRMIRSWRHVGDCDQCGQHITAELSLESLRTPSHH
jgi:hypothetical protein